MKPQHVQIPVTPGQKHMIHIFLFEKILFIYLVRCISFLYHYGLYVMCVKLILFLWQKQNQIT